MRLNRGLPSVLSGLEAADLLELAPEPRRVMVLIMRQRQMTFQQVYSTLDMQPSKVQTLLDTLVDEGYLQVSEKDGEVFYRASLARKRGRELPLHIQRALDDNK